jgi:outer membrane biosynthesis protein TonB
MRQLAFFVPWILTTNVLAADIDDTHYLVAHLAVDPRFINSIERVGGCKISGEPIPISKVRVPYQLYPVQSVAGHEEGTVRMLVIFDRDWCVRKASVVASSGYWRLDEVSLKFAMTIKFKPSIIKQYVNDEPAIEFPIAWGASQRRR